MEQDQIEKKFPNKTRDGLRYSDMQVLRTPAGYYLGRTCWNDEDGFAFEEPYSRESDYFETHEEAQEAMTNGFEIRQCVWRMISDTRAEICRSCRSKILWTRRRNT